MVDSVLPNATNDINVNMFSYFQFGQSSPAENDEWEDVESRKAPDEDEHDEESIAHSLKMCMASHLRCFKEDICTFVSYEHQGTDANQI